IEGDTIASYLVVRPGDRADAQLLDVGLKTLFNTGLFSDVTMAMQPNGMLLIEVKENPIVNRVILDGNRRVKDEKFKDEVKLTERSVFTRSKVQADVQRIIEVYRRAGRFAATVTPKVTPLEQNRVDVVYEIDEGPKTGVAKINFVGNTHFTSSQLRSVVVTSESRWWRFFKSQNANFDPDRMEYDREQLRKFYARNGYADFQVTSAVAELTPDRKDFFITFNIDEGPKYTVGDVKVKTTLAKLDESALEAFIPIRVGQTFDGDKIEKAVETLTFATGANGYAFVDVNPQIERNPESKTIDLTFNVNEGPRVYVERINILGNSRTLDKVIRREMRLSEGDAFNRILVDRSKTRVKALGYFGDDVDIKEKPGPGPDRTELDVSVKEKSTGSFSVGIGVSSTENFILDFSIEERNLMGRGQFLRFRVQASQRTRLVDIRFTQPYFLDRNLNAGFSIFNQRTNAIESGFVRDRYGVGLNAGFAVSEYGSGQLQYLLTHDKVRIDQAQSIIQSLGAGTTNLLIPGRSAAVITRTDANGNPDASGAFETVTAAACDFIQNSLSPTCESQGKFLTSLIGFTLSWDKRDDPIDPRRGWRFSVSQALAGLGGDVKYYRTEIGGAWYYPLYRGFVGALKGRAGYVDGYGGDIVRLSDRFFEGATTFRGFDVAGIGPRYLNGNGIFQGGGYVSQSIGGKAYAIGTAEVRLPVPLPKSYGIRAALFSDFGTVGLVDDKSKALNQNLALWVNPDDGRLCTVSPSSACIKPVQDDLAIRLSGGLTVSWDSPFGPVRFDIAKIFRKEFYDEVESFRFSAGTSF
ncbi:MAG: outer membrane protein assembly factor BamA, partial [Parvularculaceae bacterium]|nr:outer membrane protein assembly factor BamA [Parvularculaceae bacterium]